MKKLIIFVFLLLLSVSSYSDDTLILKNAWVREAPPMVKNLAGYAEFKNIGNEVIFIVSAFSPLFKKVSIHETSMHDGMMHMAHLMQLRLPPGESVNFEPGGKHLMLFKPERRIKAGLKVPIEFKLKSGKTVSFEFDVRK